MQAIITIMYFSHLCWQLVAIRLYCFHGSIRLIERYYISIIHKAVISISVAIFVPRT